MNCPNCKLECLREQILDEKRDLEYPPNGGYVSMIIKLIINLDRGCVSDFVSQKKRNKTASSVFVYLTHGPKKSQCSFRLRVDLCPFCCH